MTRNDCTLFYMREEGECDDSLSYVASFLSLLYDPAMCLACLVQKHTNDGAAFEVTTIGAMSSVTRWMGACLVFSMTAEITQASPPGVKPCTKDR